MQPRGHSWYLFLCALMIGAFVSGSSAVRSQEASTSEVTAKEVKGTETGSTSPLELVEISVEPAQPAAGTLCRLTARLINRGNRPISALAFEVEIEGRSLPVYEKQVFMSLVPPSTAPGDGAGQDSAVYDLRLFNFWSSDSQRPAPSDGSLDVVVRLVEAQWVDVGAEEPNTEVWSLADQVPGLPLESAVSLPIARN